MKYIKSLLITGLLTIAIAGVATPSFAQEKGEKKTEEKAKGKKGGGLPLSGKVKSIDKVNKTITVGTTTVAVTSETKLNKDGKPATLDDVKEGEEVGIYYVKTDDGKANAKSVRIGARPEGKKKEETK